MSSTKKNKNIQRLEGLIFSNLANAVPKDQKASVESLIRCIENTNKAQEIEGRNTQSFLRLILLYAKDSKKPEVQMLRKIVNQLPTAKFN